MEAIINFFKEFAALVPTIQVMDVVDILLVAFVIYKIILMLQTTSSARIAKSIVIILLLTAATSLLNMYLMNYLLDKILEIGLIALVIMFQPELRRMLDRLGSVKFRALFGYTKPTQDLETVIAQTVMACEIMSRERVGALIVFAREARLDDYFKTGTPIDGQVTEQLIRNIFFVKAPLHDGAMIIRDGRIAAAGCVLPLSDSSHLSADLGTRHRAGVGMSEVSDAVVVIVSEETGTISVAVGGMLKRHLAPQTLEKLLRNELCPKNDPDGEQVLALRLKKSLRKTDKEANTREK